MIQILLEKEKQKKCEDIFLKYMEDTLPFYPSEIYGNFVSNEALEQNQPLEEDQALKLDQVSEAKRRQIEEARETLWNYKELYSYLYLSEVNPDYPVTQGEIAKIAVYQDRLRRLLIGSHGEMETGKRREYLKEIIHKIGQIKNNDDLQKIFLYKKFSDSQEAKQILKILCMDVCPYCNRAFTITVEKGELDGTKTGVRPQFDHYFPRAIYPYLAVHLYNLIPACGKCNQLKSYHDTNEEPMLYPYDEGLGTEYVFMSYPKNGAMQYLKGCVSQENFILRIEPDLKQIYRNDTLTQKERRELEKRIVVSVEKLHLEEIYLAHTGFAADILRNRYIFCEEYIEMLHRKFPDADFSMQDVKKMLYCCDIRMENWGRNILAKLAYDMDTEIVDAENGSLEK